MTGCTTETTYGKIQGVREDGCIIFKGVPYARACLKIHSRHLHAPQKPER